MPNVGDNRLSGVVQKDLIFDEIRHVIADAIASGEVLSIKSHVERLAKTYGTSGFSKGRIADELILAAAHAQIAVQMDASA